MVMSLSVSCILQRKGLKKLLVTLGANRRTKRVVPLHLLGEHYDDTDIYCIEWNDGIGEHYDDTDIYCIEWNDGIGEHYDDTDRYCIEWNDGIGEHYDDTDRYCIGTKRVVPLHLLDEVLSDQ